MTYPSFDLCWQEGVILTRYAPNTRLTLELERQVCAARIRFAEGTQRPVLVDMAGVLSIDREVRRLWAELNGTGMVSALGLLVDEPFHGLLADAILMINRPSYPFQKFNDTSSALAWLAFFRHFN